LDTKLPFNILAFLTGKCNAENVKIISKIFIFLILISASINFLYATPIFADFEGTKKPGERCEDKGPESCQPEFDCAGYEDTPSKTKGFCMEKVDDGGKCLPKADVILDSNRQQVPYGECKSGFFCDGATILPGRTHGSPGNCRPHPGERTIGQRCESKGKDSCKSDPDPNKALDCAGFNDVPGPLNTKGTCVGKVDAGGECLPKADCKSGKCYGECKTNLVCKDADLNLIAKDKPGKCVDPLTDSEYAPPPKAPCPEGKLKDGKCTAFQTGLGELSTSTAGFIRSVFGILLAISGTLALFLIIKAGFKIMTSQGKPESIQEGRDQIIAAIVGLAFLIFSLVFLEVIGVNLLRIPDFRETNVSQGHCSSCETADSCTARGGKSLGTIDCSAGTICCE
jgi:hypothetical protein